MYENNIGQRTNVTLINEWLEFLMQPLAVK